MATWLPEKLGLGVEEFFIVEVENKIRNVTTSSQVCHTLYMLNAYDIGFQAHKVEKVITSYEKN